MYLDLDPANVRGDKFLSNSRKEEILNFLIAYLDVFRDPLLEKIYASVLKTRFISTQQIEIIEKRKAAISSTEIISPAKYVQKYFADLMTIEIGMKKFPNLSHEQLDKLLSLLEFYTNYGYLTQKQIRMSNTILSFKTESHKNSIVTTCLGNAKEALNSLNKAGCHPQFYLKSILSKLQRTVVNSIIIKPEKEYLKEPLTYVLCDLMDEMKVKITIEKNIEEAASIPKGFLSLEEMRNALMFVG